MKIALPGIKGEFSNNTGEGVKRYYFELYKGLCNIGVDVDKIESSSILGDIPSFIIENSLRNYRKYDIVHAPGIRAMKPLSAGIFGMTAHDFRPMLDRVWEQELPVGVMGRIYKELVLLGFREALKCDFLICDSSQTKDEAVELGYDKKRAFVVNLGLDYRFMSPVRHINNKNNFKVGYLGSMSKHKNIKMSINAFKLVKDPNMMFEIWGQKVMEYSNLLQLAGKDKRIIFNGFAPEVKLVEIYDTFDVFVHCVLSTGFELELLEAQARGKPVVYS